MPKIEISTGATLDYLDTGAADKPVLLLVHGLLGTAEIHFARIIDWLKDDYRLIGPTMRGYGESEPKPRKFPANFYHHDADDLLAFMDALNIEQAHLMGYSDGGEVSLIAAAKQPHRFLSVSVWGAVGYFGPAMRPIAQRMFPATWITEEEKQRNHIKSADGFILGWIQAVRQMIDSGGDVSLSIAHQITAPLLLMLGEDDRLNPIEYGQNYIDRVPNARLATFPCGHAVHDEAWIAFQREIGKLLR